MGKIIVWQMVLLVVAIAIAAWVWGVAAIGSVVLGGLCYLLPTILAIVLLSILKKIPDLLPVALMATELGKIILVCLMMLVVYLAYPAANWLAFLLGLILVSQAGLFTFGKRLVL
ncbi:ATP synthase subunit I [Snodgrassella sp. CFCC 13594]|uniref:ATP synthase subunit I n=1 Tax=Snodgrassella sp. CFCC 13594 TaxID=1775559 RepID=UPI0008369092|nr:ATP synthase subunit I [Snodgrassella sp. CFCC 13594]